MIFTGLIGPLPPEMRDDTAFMDRIHAYLPGWDLPKINRELLTGHFGMVSDFLSECWDQLRQQSRQNLFHGRVHVGGALSGQDTTAVLKTVSGLIKLVSPNPETPVPDDVIEWAVRIGGTADLHASSDFAVATRDIDHQSLSAHLGRMGMQRRSRRTLHRFECNSRC